MDNINRERRKYKRYALREEAYAGLYPKVGEIVDICLGGIAFRYLDLNKSEQNTDDLVIFGDDGACLTGLKHKTVSDKSVNDLSDFSTMMTRERRLSFEQMTEGQKMNLKNFIENHRIV